MSGFDNNWTLAQDTNLPQRDLLLDAFQMTRRFNQLLGKHQSLVVESCTRLRTKYRLGLSLRVLYEVLIKGRPHFIAARAFPSGSRATKDLNSNCFVSEGAQLPPVFHDGRINTAFWSFPNDRKIKHLRALVDVPPGLSSIGGNEWVNSRVVAHAPEKSVTAQCLNVRGEVVAYAKIYATDEGHRIRATYDSIRTSLQQNKRSPAVPSVLAYADDTNLLLLEAIQGNPLNASSGRHNTTVFTEFGMALAHLHQIEPSESVPEFVRLAPRFLNEAAWTIAHARPDVALKAAQLASSLTSTYSNDETPVVLHGDVHTKNFVVTDSNVSLIDLDQSGRGPAAADLGSFLASLHYEECTGRTIREQRLTLEQSFLSGYERVRPLPNQRSLSWHTAAALLSERAFRSVNRVRVAGLLHLPDVLERATEVLTSV
ncbi:MAG TPA: phosphotransferase [Pyrinomonadaceae bacterium]|nr:phosphotransferase [Pyrinomonadaceae bacterium]